MLFSWGHLLITAEVPHYFLAYFAGICKPCGPHQPTQTERGGTQSSSSTQTNHGQWGTEVLGSSASHSLILEAVTYPGKLLTPCNTPLPQYLKCLFTCFYSSISTYDSSRLNTDDVDGQIPFPVGRSACNGHAERFAGVFSDTYHLLMASDHRMQGLKAQTEKQI